MGRGEEERREGERGKGEEGGKGAEERERGMGGHPNPTPLIGHAGRRRGWGGKSSEAKRGEGREKRRKRGWKS